MTDSSRLERRQVYFGGHVQGVGFRYTTRKIAADYAVTGFARNLADGRVELVVEGERRELDAFLAEVGRQMAGYIRETVSDRGRATGEFEGFEIRL